MNKERRTRSTVARRTARRTSRRTRRGQFALTREERGVLKEACQRYLHELPSYLKATQPEMGLIQGILRKL